MKSPARFAFVRRTAPVVLSAVLAVLCGALHAHPAWEYLPATDGPVTLIAPDLAREGAFLPDAKDNPVLRSYDEFVAKLKAKRLNVSIHSFTVFPDGFLLNTSATPATVRYILKYKILGEDYTWTESEKDGGAVFTLSVPEKGSYRITFPAKEWLLFTANRPPAPADDPAIAKASGAAETKPDVDLPPTASELLKAVPSDAAIAYLWPEPGATPEYPLMGELRSISFHVAGQTASAEGKASAPVLAEIAMPAKTPDSALKIQNACQSTIDEVYAEAAKLGKIPQELVGAFTVTRKDAVVTIRISLPADMAKYFFTTFAQALQGMVSPLAVPEKLQ